MVHLVYPTQGAVYCNNTTEQGSIFRSKNYIYPPPTSENDIFSPSRGTSFFDSHRGLFALILPYFTIILPVYCPFSHFLSPFFLFLSPFFFFLLNFPPFSHNFFIFFPLNDLGWYLSPPQGGGGGIFQYIGPCNRVDFHYRGITNVFKTRYNLQFVSPQYKFSSA